MNRFLCITYLAIVVFLMVTTSVADAYCITAENCNRGYYCEKSWACTSECKPRKKLGEPCSFNDDCLEGTRCDSWNRKCVRV